MARSIPDILTAYPLVHAADAREVWPPEGAQVHKQGGTSGASLTEHTTRGSFPYQLVGSPIRPAQYRARSTPAGWVTSLPPRVQRNGLASCARRGERMSNWKVHRCAVHRSARVHHAKRSAVKRYVLIYALY